jgi:hypothetical protein
VLAEHQASAEAARRQAEAEAQAACAELESVRAQVRPAKRRLPGQDMCKSRAQQCNMRALMTRPLKRHLAEASAESSGVCNDVLAMKHLTHPFLQASGMPALDAAALREQLAAAQARAQVAAAENATLQQRLDSEATAAAGKRQQLEAQLQRQEADQRQLETNQEAAQAAAAEHYAAVEAGQKRAVADAKAARAELDFLKAQVRKARAFQLSAVARYNRNKHMAFMHRPENMSLKRHLLLLHCLWWHAPVVR